MTLGNFLDHLRSGRLERGLADEHFDEASVTYRRAIYNQAIAGTVRNAQAPTEYRKCRFEERPQGVIINSDTGQPASLNDLCIERGTTMAYNAEATDAARRALVGRRFRRRARLAEDARIPRSPNDGVGRTISLCGGPFLSGP